MFEDTSAGEFVFWVISGMVVLGIVGVVILSLVGLHINTGNGSHVGFVTSVETTGVIFKTDRAYIKTDTQSSQEDAYCVVDSAVFADLKKASEAHERVEVSYFSWFSSGVANCAGEGDVISGVKAIK